MKYSCIVSSTDVTFINFNSSNPLWNGRVAGKYSMYNSALNNYSKQIQIHTSLFEIKFWISNYKI